MLGRTQDMMGQGLLKYLFHITHIENLPIIVQTGGLMCDSRKIELVSPPISIAYEDIKDKRTKKQVLCGPGGCIADYVPFYFAPQSPMLYTISRGNVPDRRQDDIVYLVSAIEWVVERNLGYIFTDGHPIMAFTSFYDNLDDLANIDWNVMKAKIWHDTDADPDRKRRRQAEFLVHEFLPWELIQYICVMNENAGKAVEEIIDGLEHHPTIFVKRRWYYG